MKATTEAAVAMHVVAVRHGNMRPKVKFAFSLPVHTIANEYIL